MRLLFKPLLGLCFFIATFGVVVFVVSPKKGTLLDDLLASISVSKTRKTSLSPTPAVTDVPFSFESESEPTELEPEKLDSEVLNSASINKTYLTENVTNNTYTTNNNTSTLNLSDVGTNRLLVINGENKLAVISTGNSGQFLRSLGEGSMPTWADASSTSSLGFASLTSGTNTSGDLVIGSGSSLTYSGGTGSGADLC